MQYNSLLHIRPLDGFSYNRFIQKNIPFAFHVYKYSALALSISMGTNLTLAYRKLQLFVDKCNNTFIFDSISQEG